MNYKRADRVAAQILADVSQIILREMADPDMGFMTITRVKVTDDLRLAKIYYSVLGDEAEQKKATEALHKAQGHIRAELGHRLSLRFVPELVFYYDDTAAYADHINRILNKIHQTDSPPDLDPVAE
ncbi:MAG TPA: 30S ribosome-binding factor RbfA [bacterium]|nr:30S ribosome-binding factor RbfA [bacterium]